MSRTSNRLTVASRGSALALRQCEIVSALLKRAHPELEVEVLVVKTAGDKDSRPFAAIGGKGLFTSEVERAVVEGDADVAVHSAKDLTAELASGCSLIAIPPRAPNEDVVVGGSDADGDTRLAMLRPGSTVGTSSMRRRALLAELRGDLEVVELRGNLDTRLRKVAEGSVDAAILARAGIERIGADVSFGSLAPERWVPPPGQGALAIEALADRGDLVELFSALDDPGARAEVMCERAFGARLEGGCSVPLGCSARAGDGAMVVTGFLGLPDGLQSIRDRISGPPNQAESLGRELAEAILASGGDEILRELQGEIPPEIDAP